jgi:peptidoglycan hydrolase CwlO-like protein
VGKKINLIKYVLLTLTVLSFPVYVYGVSNLDKDNHISVEYPYIPIGQSDSEDSDKLDEISKEIEELENKLKEVQNREKTLQSQLTYMDSQISLTTLKIGESENEIELLEDQIASLSGKIVRLEASLTDISEVLLNRIVATYKSKAVSPIYYLVSSQDFNEFFTRSKYIQVAQAHDKKLMYSVQSTKSSFQKQKDLREVKKDRLVVLQQQLSLQKQELDKQKSEKTYLLGVTRQDEKRYQQLIAAARSEQAAIEGAIRQALALLKDGSPVNQGEQIALIGNSGAPSCSTGAHLHFEIRKGESVHNPSDYLKGNSIEWNNQPDGEFGFGGDWDWPIDSPRITQGYGMTYWARTGFYGGRPHTGIDMTSNSSSVIRAPKGGTLYKGTISCKGSPMNFVAIEHEDDLTSWYWHVK